MFNVNIPLVATTSSVIETHIFQQSLHRVTCKPQPFRQSVQLLPMGKHIQAALRKAAFKANALGCVLQKKPLSMDEVILLQSVLLHGCRPKPFNYPKKGQTTGQQHGLFPISSKHFQLTCRELSFLNQWARHKVTYYFKVQTVKCIQKGAFSEGETVNCLPIQSNQQGKNWFGSSL